MQTVIEYRYGCIFCRDGVMRDLDEANAHDVSVHPELVEDMSDIHADWAELCGEVE